jgi:hypothetical protein
VPDTGRSETRNPLIWDCFTFFDELLLLEIRLQELSQIVDRFVLVEATKTFQGDPKPLHFAEHAARFAPWHDQIVHVVVNDMPAASAWVAEAHQRRAIRRGLVDAQADDVILISDADEMPRPGAVAALREMDRPTTLEVEMTYYTFNSMVPKAWTLSKMKATRLRDLEDPEGLRNDDGLPMMRRAGWHFSYLGDANTARRKLGSFSHVEFNVDCFRTPTHIDRCRRLGVDLFGRFTLRTRPEVSWLPQTVQFRRHELDALFQPRGGSLAMLQARGYQVVARHRRELNVQFADDHPVLAFAFLAGVIPVRRFLRALRRRLNRRRASAD